MGTVMFGQYIPKKSPIHQLNPVLKLAFLVVLIFFIFATNAIFALFLTLCLSIIAIFCTKISFKNYLHSNKFIIALSIFISISFFLIDYYINSAQNTQSFCKSLDASCVILLRLILLAILNSIFLFTTSINEISHSIEYLLSPLRILGLNLREFSLIMSMFIKFLPIISEEIHKIISFQKSRGYNFEEKNILKRIKTYSKIATPLIRKILKRADYLASAMVSRGYSLNAERTQFKKISIKKCDIISLFLFLTIIFGVIACNNIIMKNLNLFCGILH